MAVMLQINFKLPEDLFDRAEFSGTPDFFELQRCIANLLGAYVGGGTFECVRRTLDCRAVAIADSGPQSTELFRQHAQKLGDYFAEELSVAVEAFKRFVDVNRSFTRVLLALWMFLQT